MKTPLLALPLLFATAIAAVAGAITIDDFNLPAPASSYFINALNPDPFSLVTNLGGATRTLTVDVQGVESDLGGRVCGNRFARCGIPERRSGHERPDLAGHAQLCDFTESEPKRVQLLFVFLLLRGSAFHSGYYGHDYRRYAHRQLRIAGICCSLRLRCVPQQSFR